MPDRAVDNHGPQESAMERLDARIAQALETAPEYVIPSGFADRTARRLPVRAVVPAIRARHCGRQAAIACLPILLVLILVFAHRPSGRSLLWALLEWTFCVEFALLAFWLSGWRLDVTMFRGASD